MRRFFIGAFLSIFVPVQVSASVLISSLLPNPSGDDTLGEYIEIRNTGCHEMDISHYNISDAVGKSYTIPSGTSLPSLSNRSFPHSETNIALNNSGNESVFLKDAGGNIIDSYNYSGTQKENIILKIPISDEICPPQEDQDHLGSTSTGEAQSGSGDLTPTIEQSNTDVLKGSGTLDTQGNDSGNSNYESTVSGEVTGIGDGGSQTGVIFTGSGNTMNESSDSGNGGNTGLSPDTTETGAILENYTETGILLPEELFYSDVNTNGYIDTLEIVYPYSLSGIVNTGAISLYSNTGGLFSYRINTLTGSILDGFLSGNILILKIQEGDITHTILKINNTTSSELRLKSSGDIGFRSIGGKVPENFFLTSSFENYTKVSTKNILIYGGNPSLNTEIVSGDGSGNSLPNIDIPQNGNTGITIPSIEIMSQSPSNVIFSGSTLICTSLECRMNITLEPIFSSGIMMKDFFCSFGTGEELLTKDSDCNPNTYYFTSSGIFLIEIESKHYPYTKVQKIYTIEWQIPQQIPKIGESTPIFLGNIDTGKPKAHIEIDGKWKEYYEQIGDYELNCYTRTCSINFTAEKSIDPEGSSMRWLWIYGINDISTSRDPGTRKYEIGDHEIILRVIDAAGNSDELRYKIHVLGAKPKEIKSQDIKVIKTKKIEKSIIASFIKKKKPKKIRMIFFTPPELVLQGRTGKTLAPLSYSCLYKKKPLCSINFTLSGSLRGYEYGWSLDGKELYRGKNPSVWKLSPGIHKGTIISYYKNSNTPLSISEFSIQVAPEPKKIKKSQKSKTKKNLVVSKKQMIPKFIPEVNANNDENIRYNSPYSHIGFIFFLFGIIIGIFLHKRRKI